jgi:hypothetical protein
MEATKENDKNITDYPKVAVGCRIPASDKTKREAEAKEKGYKNITQYLEAILTGKENICLKEEAPVVYPSVNMKDEDFDTIEQRVSLLLEEKTEPLLRAINDLNGNVKPVNELPAVSEEHSLLKTENERLAKELDSFVNIPSLKELFATYEGKELKYKTPSGEEKKMEVKSISDVVKVLSEAANTSNK